jgi:hypothetical protein
VTNAFDYVRLTFYAPPEFQARAGMVYEPDPGAPGYRAGGEFVCLFNLQPYWPLRLETYREFLRAGGPFTLVMPFWEKGWVQARLLAAGYRFALRGRAGTNDVYSVEPGSPGDAAAKSTYPP